MEKKSIPERFETLKQLVDDANLKHWLDFMDTSKGSWKKISQDHEGEAYISNLSNEVKTADMDSGYKTFVVKSNFEKLAGEKNDILKAIYEFVKNRDLETMKKWAKGIIFFKSFHKEEKEKEENKDYTEFAYMEFDLPFPFNNRYYMAMERILWRNNECIVFTRTLPEKGELSVGIEEEKANAVAKSVIRGEMISLRVIKVIEKEGKPAIDSSLLVWGNPKLAKFVANGNFMAKDYIHDLRETIVIPLKL